MIQKLLIAGHMLVEVCSLTSEAEAILTTQVKVECYWPLIRVKAVDSLQITT